MKVQETIFHFVHTLTESDVRFVQTGLPRQMRILFDALLEQKEYDKEDLLKRLDFVGRPALLSRLKYATFDRILTILSRNDRYNDRISVLERTRSQVGVLMSKGFYREAEKRLVHGIKIAEDLEMFGNLTELFSFWWEIRPKDEWQVDGQAFWNCTPEEFRAASERFAETARMHMILLELADSLRRPKDKSEKAKLLQEKWEQLPPIEICKSLRAKVYHLRIQYTLHRAVNAVDNWSQCSERIVELLNLHSQLLEDRPVLRVYVKHMYHIALVRIANHDFDEVTGLIRRIESIANKPPSARGIEPEIQQRIWVLQLNIERQKRDWERIRSAIATVREDLSDGRHRQSDPTIRMILLRRGLELSIYLGNLLDARFFNNRLQAEIKRRVPPYLAVMARIMELILFLEAKEYELLEAGLRRVRRYFKKYRYESPFTTCWIELFKVACKQPFPQDANSPIQEFLERLTKLSREPYYSDYFNAFDFKAWATAKHQNTTVSRLENPNS